MPFTIWKTYISLNCLIGGDDSPDRAGHHVGLVAASEGDPGRVELVHTGTFVKTPTGGSVGYRPCFESSRNLRHAGSSFALDVCRLPY